MSSVSGFIGFVVISIFPSQISKTVRIRRPTYPHKSGDSLIVGDDERRDDPLSDEDTTPLASNQRAHDAASSAALLLADPVESANPPALTKPDFWILAFIMAMRMLSFGPTLKSFVVSGCGLMYINVQIIHAFSEID
jgi:hypothetical protein